MPPAYGSDLGTIRLYSRVVVVQVRRVFWTRVFGPRAPALPVGSDLSEVRVRVVLGAGAGAVVRFRFFRQHFRRVGHRKNSKKKNKQKNPLYYA